MKRFTFWHCMALALVAVLIPPSSAKAQSSNTLLEATPWLVTNKGPADARGVIFFMRGFNRLVPVVDDYKAIHPFILSLNAQGWDVIAAKYRYQRSYDFFPVEKVPNIAATMAVRARALRAQGYRRVVFGGQSLGGWAALYSARNSGLKAEALLLLAPAAWGMRVNPLNGNPNNNFARNRSDFLPMISTVTTPTAAIFFRHDEFDPGGRGQFTKTSLEKRSVPHLVLNEPPGFTGHGAGWLPPFDYVYGKCLSGFLQDGQTQSCEPEPLSNSDFRAVVARADVAPSKTEVIKSIGALEGRKFVVYPMDGNAALYSFDIRKSVSMLATQGSQKRDVTVSNDSICIAKECVTLVKWDETRIIAFNIKTGAAEAWWIELKT